MSVRGATRAERGSIFVAGGALPPSPKSQSTTAFNIAVSNILKLYNARQPL